VLAQLGNRVQHALRAYTPRDQEAVKATASTMRQNPKIDIETAITELEVGEALVSFLDEKGRPSVTERVYVLPPASKIGPITPEQRKALQADSIVAGAYEKTIDRESAYEKIKGHAAERLDTPAGKTASKTATEEKDSGIMGGINDVLFGKTGPRGGIHDGLAQTMVKSAVRTIGSSVGRQIIRGVLGGIFGGRR
jgi:DNA helicase HerA-like ATPase